MTQPPNDPNVPSAVPPPTQPPHPPAPEQPRPVVVNTSDNALHGALTEMGNTLRALPEMVAAAVREATPTTAQPAAQTGNQPPAQPSVETPNVPATPSRKGHTPSKFAKRWFGMS